MSAHICETIGMTVRLIIHNKHVTSKQRFYDARPPSATLDNIKTTLIRRHD